MLPRRLSSKQALEAALVQRLYVHLTCVGDDGLVIAFTTESTTLTVVIIDVDPIEYVSPARLLINNAQQSTSYHHLSIVERIEVAS